MSIVLPPYLARPSSGPFANMALLATL